MTALDLPLTTLLVTALVVALAYGVYGVTGFGASLLAVPLLAHLFSLRTVVPMMLLFDLVIGFLFGIRNRKEVAKAELVRLMPFLLIGMVLGATLLSKVAEGILLTVLGLFVLGYAAWGLLSKAPATPISTHWAAPAGVVGGAFTAMYGTGGPLYAIYLTRRLPNMATVRSSLSVLIMGAALARLLLFTAAGFYQQPGLIPLAAGLLPFVLIGCAAGVRLHSRVSTSTMMKMVWLLLIVAGASLLRRGTGGL